MKKHLYSIATIVLTITLILLGILIPLCFNNTHNIINYVADTDTIFYQSTNLDTNDYLLRYGSESTVIIPINGAEVEVYVNAENWIWPSPDRVIIRSRFLKGSNAQVVVDGCMHWTNGNTQDFRIIQESDASTTVECVKKDRWACDNITYTITVSYNGKSTTTSEMKLYF